MVKLPIQAEKWAGLGKRRGKFMSLHIFLSLGFIYFTYSHCKTLSESLREKKIQDLTAEISTIANDEKSKQEMLKVFGIRP